MAKYFLKFFIQLLQDGPILEKMLHIKFRRCIDMKLNLHVENFNSMKNQDTMQK